MSDEQSNPSGTATVEPKRNGRAPRAPVDHPAARPRGLADALLAFQAEAPKLRRDATGQIQSRSYAYTTLDGMLDDIVPLLMKYELLWRAYPTTLDGQPALRYRLTHVPSGETEEDVMPLLTARLDSQGHGSALTYARRYALLAVLNLAPGEDDDGAAASSGNHSKMDTFLKSTPEPTERLATPGQQRLLSVRAQKASLSAVQFADLILRVTLAEPRDWEDGEGEAREWLERALPHLPQRHVDPVLHAVDQEAIAR